MSPGDVVIVVFEAVSSSGVVGNDFACVDAVLGVDLPKDSGASTASLGCSNVVSLK